MALFLTAFGQNSKASTILGLGMERITDMFGNMYVVYETPIHGSDLPPIDLGQTSGWPATMIHKSATDASTVAVARDPWRVKKGSST